MLGAFATATAPAAVAGELAAKFKVGDKAPDFTLEDVEGRQVRLSDITRNKVVLLAFWSLRCEACLLEVPYIEQIHQTFVGRGVAVLSVVTDGLDKATTKTMMRNTGACPSYPVLVDPDYAVSDVYTTFVVPHTLVIDRKGIVRYVHTGFEPGTEKQHKAALDLVLRP
jgi:peroxiredoxin